MYNSLILLKKTYLKGLKMKYIIDYTYTCTRDVTIEARSDCDAIRKFEEIKRSGELGSGQIAFKDIMEA
jgi:hypothetical protein